MDHSTTHKLEKRQKDVGIRRHRRNGGCPRDVERTHPVMYVRRVARRSIRPGAVILAEVPFSDCDEHKVRPVVVLDLRGDQVSVLPCSTTVGRFDHPACWHELVDLDAAGLARATGVQKRIVRLDRAALIEVRGTLGDEDFEMVVGGAPIRVAS